MDDRAEDERVRQMVAQMQERRRDPARFVGPERYILLTLRVLFLLVAVGLLGFVPVTVYRCQPSGQGTATCGIEERRWLGLQTLEVRQVSGITSAWSAPNRWAIRLDGTENRTLFEKAQSAVVGTSMVSVVRRVTATTRVATAAPWTAWQFPLPVALFAGAAMAFVASGPTGWLWRLRRRGQEEAQAAGRPARVSAIDFVMPIGMLAVAAFVSWLSPVVVYRCVPDAGAMACRVEWRAAGLVTLEAIDVPQVARATSSKETVRHREYRDGEWRESREEVTKVSLLDAGGALLFEDEQSGVIGTDGATLAAEINALAAGGSTLVRWQAAWLSLLFVAVVTLLAGLTSLSLIWKLARRSPVRES